MFEIIFYQDVKGNSEVVSYLDELKQRSLTSKTDWIKRQKILTYIQALATYGTRIGLPYVKHLENDLWELRPLSDRIFFFVWTGGRFVLLHHFVKKSQKTPINEIKRAHREIEDFIIRNEQNGKKS